MFNYEVESNEYDNLEECVNVVYELASKYAIDGVRKGMEGLLEQELFIKKIMTDM